MTQDPNLPPGCSVSDLPGHRPVDDAWDEFVNDKEIVTGIILEYLAGIEPEDLVDLLYGAGIKQIDEEVKNTFEKEWEHRFD